MVWQTRMRDDPAHWRQRAQDSRAEAEKLDDPDTKATLLEIAEAYERLAVLAEKRGNPKKAGPA
jgi:hypothetical protein